MFNPYKSNIYFSATSKLKIIHSVHRAMIYQLCSKEASQFIAVLHIQNYKCLSENKLSLLNRLATPS